MQKKNAPNLFAKNFFYFAMYLTVPVSAQKLLIKDRSDVLFYVTIKFRVNFDDPVDSVGDPFPGAE